MIRAPDLDTIAFDALVERGRALIPRYAPKWTDHNVHDPGITLLELIAWIVDQQIYRVGFVGDRHIAAFAALLGLSPLPARPARGILWPSGPAAGGSVTRGARAATRAAPDLGFEIERAIDLSQADPVNILLNRGDSDGPVEVDGAREFEFVPGDRLDFVFDRVLAPHRPQTIALGFAMRGRDGQSGEGERTDFDRIALSSRIDSGGWRPLQIVDDGTMALSRSGVVTIKVPASPGARATLRLSADGAVFPERRFVRRLAFNALPVAQIAQKQDHVLGEGTGLPEFTVGFDPDGLLPPSGETEWLETGFAGRREKWREVDDFERSGPGDRDFVFDRRRSVIRFGNGLNGQVPPSGDQIIADTARTGGSAGNLAAGRDWNIAGTTTPYRNDDPLTGGREAEPIDELLDRMRAEAGRLCAAVTDGDLCAAALELDGMGIAEAAVHPRLWPGLPGRAASGCRTVVVKTWSGRSSPAHLQAIGEALAKHRIAGECLAVVAAAPKPIDLEVRLALGDRPEAEVRDEVRRALRACLSPDTWPPGRPVTANELSAVAAAVVGVRAVVDLAVAGADHAGSFALEKHEVAEARAVEIAFETGEVAS